MEPVTHVRIEPCPRRVRAFFDGVAVVDSTRAQLLLERDRLPVYYFPADDVRTDLLASPAPPRSSRKGTVVRWALRAGNRTAHAAAWCYVEPVPAFAAIGGYIAFSWSRIDAWFEEDEEVFVHPVSPYHRVDVLHSSRRVRVAVSGTTLAETNRPRLLFETGLPVRYYLPQADVRMDLLVKSETTTQCPYKGIASHWSARVSAQTITDVAWCYRFPIPECAKI